MIADASLPWQGTATLVLFGVFGLDALAELARTKLVLHADRIEAVDGFRRGISVARDEIAEVSAEGARLAVRTTDGIWHRLPSPGATAHALAMTLRHWRR